MTSLEQQLDEAVEARKHALTTDGFTRARARETYLRERLALEERNFSTKQRSTMANKGQAMPGGRYPIANASDLANAIQAFGRGSPADKPAIKRHIIKRARALGLESKLPADWTS